MGLEDAFLMFLREHIWPFRILGDEAAFLTLLLQGVRDAFLPFTSCTVEDWLTAASAWLDSGEGTCPEYCSGPSLRVGLGRSLHLTVFINLKFILGSLFGLHLECSTLYWIGFHF